MGSEAFPSRVVEKAVTEGGVGYMCMGPVLCFLLMFNNTHIYRATEEAALYMCVAVM